MSWNDFHARGAVLQLVMERARVDPGDPGLFVDLPDMEKLFGGPDGVLLALEHRWTTHLAAKLDQAIEDGAPPNTAWNELTAEQPVLRAVLDRYAGRSRSLREAQQAERGMIGAHFNAQVHADDSGGLGRDRPESGAAAASPPARVVSRC
ncbi:hypothetical protein [Rhodococcus maanshanensis]|uniref:Uncharacterized protein n=1 Tax=Rhodococcus maanshanensis TaxID=183556 RepID=A0A1H7X518_9NOCA|nr:hypothetical protein [Rhodococcus maanshanensis]SEM28803.1 hypothetical protein SAMN05444583_13062 [Rhodococcus maanshanensis]